MKWTRVSSLFAATLLAASSLAAQTTGRIEGRIRDDAGAAIPGVAVVATAETLPGEIRVVTDQGGAFRLVSLPPGVYLVKAELDGFNEPLPPLKDFILPGGGPAAAACHVARTVVRRAERRVWSLAHAGGDVGEDVPRYLNRLSDLLFVLARVLARHEHGAEVLWRHDRGRGGAG